MPLDFHLAPLLIESTVAVDQKGAALDAAYLLAIHILHLDDIEEIAQLLTDVRDQLKWELLLCLEILLSLEAVPGCAQNDAGLAAELVDGGAEISPLLGAAGGARPGIEIDDQRFANIITEPDTLVAGDMELDIRNFFTDGNCLCHRTSLSDKV